MKKILCLSLVLWLLTGCVSPYTPQNAQTTRQNLSPEEQRAADCDNGDSQACHWVFLRLKSICESSSTMIVNYNTYHHSDNGFACLVLAKTYSIQQEADKFNINTNSAEAVKISFRYSVKACFLGNMEACSHLEGIKMKLEQVK